MGLIRNIIYKRALNKDLKNKKKSVTLYAVVDIENMDKGEVLTYQSTLNDSADWVLAKIAKDHDEHYKNWCSLRDISSDSKDSLVQYINECLGGIDYVENKYIVQSVDLATEDIVTICNTLLESFNKEENK